MYFTCPVCGKELIRGEKAVACENGHSFDLSKSGYVNLLMSQQSNSKRHGDDKLMVRARRDFLDAGYYAPLRDALSAEAAAHAYDGCVLLDAGCGECYYTSAVAERIRAYGISADILAIDISKAALNYGVKRSADISAAVASVFAMPVADESCDIVTSLFAPLAVNEFARVLRSGGVLILAVPGRRHLWELKAAVYDNPYENDDFSGEMNGFTFVGRRKITDSINLTSNCDIMNLFMMTPYYYKTSAHDQEKLRKLDTLSTTVEFELMIYQKLGCYNR
jgi:23S rRNA (guanine745-N1)-methyltransferase